VSRSDWRDGERSRTVDLRALGPRRWQVNVDGTEFEVFVDPMDDGRMQIRADGGTHVAEVTADGARRFVRLGALDFVLERESVGRASRATHHGGLEAPMPGSVTRVMVSTGDAVTRGQTLMVLEAMKMEHMVRAPRDGRVRSVRAHVGDRVEPGVPLIELENLEPAADTPAGPPPTR
jgi:biotin carboxyl carrier protein